MAQATENPPQSISEAQFLSSLKQFIEVAYKDGIDRFISWDVVGDTIQGVFQDGPKAFDFSLSAKSGLDYGVSKTGQQKVLDSLLIDHPELRGQSRNYVISYQDAVTGKPRNCDGPTSFSCGESCINNEKRCRTGATAIASPEQISRLVDAGKQIKKTGGARPTEKPQEPAIPPAAGAMGKAGAIAAGAALLGLPVATYAAIRMNYRKGYDESAKQAKEMAFGMGVPNVGKDKSDITFTVGGFAGDSKGGERLASYLKDLGVDHHHITPISNEEFDIRTPEEVAKGVTVGNGQPIPIKDLVTRGMRTFLRTSVTQGRNPVAVKIAAQAYAYHQQYPDKPITLFGHSAGGISVREAAEILEKMGVKSRVIAMGSPYFGLTEPTEDNITITSNQDPVIKATGYSVMNGVWMNDVGGHEIGEYFKSETFREFLKTRLQKRSRLDKQDQCKIGKPCGEACVAKGLTCRVQLSGQAVAALGNVQAALKKEGRLGSPVLPAIAAATGVSGTSAATAVAVSAGVAAGAALLGTPVAAYMAQREKYREGFGQSAEMAKAEASSYSVPDKLKAGFRSIGSQSPDKQTFLKDQFSNSEPDQLTFFVGGLGSDGQEGDYMGEEVAAMFPSHLVVAVESEEFSVSPRKGDRVFHPSFLQRAVKTVAGKSLEEGRNPVAVRTAARAYAYHQKHPNKPINLVGQSGGTMVVREAAEILSQMGIKDVRVASSGGPYFGLTEPSGITLSADADPLRKMAGMFFVNPVQVKTPLGHTHYFVADGHSDAKVRAKDRRNGKPTAVNEEVQAILRNHFDRSKRRDSVSPTAIRVGQAITQMIEEGFRDGVDTLLSAELEGSNIKGQFRKKREVFNFTIGSKGELSYVEANSRGDADTFDVLSERDLGIAITQLINQSFTGKINRLSWIGINADDELVGEFIGQSRPFEFSLNELGLEYKPLVGKSLLDEIRTDKRDQCSKSTSYPCGESCINNEKVCRVGANKLRGKAELQQFVGAAKLAVKTKGMAIAQVPGRGATVRTPLLFLLPVVPIVSAALQTSIAMGLTSAAYLALRAKYRTGLNESVDEVKKMAARIEPEDIQGKANVTLTTGGFSGDAKGGERLKGVLERPEMGLGDHHFVPISNEGFDIAENLGQKEGAGAGDFLKLSLATVSRTVLKRGHNPTARDIAAQAYAYKQKYPNATINLIGHSGGGIASHEAAEILERLGVKTQVAALGSPHFEFAKPTERSITFASKNDPITNGILVMNPRWINEVKGHNIEDYFESQQVVSGLRAFLNEKPKRQDAADAIAQKQFLRQLTSILERSYTDGIDEYLDIKISDKGDVSGIFRDRQKAIEFSITPKDISTKLTKAKTRRDSYLEGFFLSQLQPPSIHFDARPSRKRKGTPNCRVGITCRRSCIEATDTCRISTSEVASPREMQQLRKSALRVKSETSGVPEADPLDNLSIRDLKKKAAQEGIYRYSVMNKEQLKGAIRASKDKPEQQERLRKTFEKKKVEREALEGTPVGSYAKSWQQVQKLGRLAGINPSLASAGIVALITGLSVKVYQDARAHYREGIKESAESAVALAEKLEAPSTTKPNITFTVGGFNGLNSSGESLKDELERWSDRPDATEADQWFRRSNQIISFDNKNFDVPTPGIEPKLANGAYNPAYLGYVMKEGFGKMADNFIKRRNPAAVELAAQIYAYGNKLDLDGNRVNEDKTLNVLAHSAGGLTAREAVDIISEMPDGKKVLKQLNLVTLGTPDFGFTDRRNLERDITISSVQDPFSILPKRREKLISSVKGHEISDYLENEDVISEIRRQFGYSRTSTYYRQRQAEKRKRTKTKAKQQPSSKKGTGTSKQKDLFKGDSAYSQGFASVLRG